MRRAARLWFRILLRCFKSSAKRRLRSVESVNAAADPMKVGDFTRCNMNRSTETAAALNRHTQRQHEWAVILAGGDGTRLKSHTRRIAGDERTKQFCPVLSGATLLEETHARTSL